MAETMIHPDIVSAIWSGQKSLIERRRSQGTRFVLPRRAED